MIMAVPGPSDVRAPTRQEGSERKGCTKQRSSNLRNDSRQQSSPVLNPTVHCCHSANSSCINAKMIRSPRAQFGTCSQSAQDSGWDLILQVLIPKLVLLGALLCSNPGFGLDLWFQQNRCLGCVKSQSFSWADT